MAKAGGIAAERLKSFVERIEKLREEKKAIGDDERDVFSEAKGVGFDTKAMREVLKRRAMDDASRDEWDTLVDTYEHALGLRGEAASIVAKGGTYDQAAEKTGISRATVARTVAAAASIKNLKNETLQTPEFRPVGDGRGTAESSSPAPAVAISNAAPHEGDNSVAAMGVSPQPVPEGGEGAGTITAAQEPDLTIPSFLDRRVVA